MPFIDQWREQLPSTLAACRTAVKAAGTDVIGLDPKYGIFASGLLWPVREAGVEDDQRNALRDVCGGKDEVKPLLKAIREWPDYLTAARELSESAKGNVLLTIALEKVIAHFQDALVNSKFVTIDIHDTTIQSAIVNIGGKQFFYGDVVVSMIQQVIHSCPKAPAPPKHFTGRAEEIKRLIAQLTGPNVIAITAVSGIGGVGKTTLAQALCQSPDSPFKSVLWAEINENPNVDQTLLTWGRYAKDTFAPPLETPIEQIADLVRAMVSDLVVNECGDPILVVFDDIWNNESCYQAVKTLQRAMPVKAQVLITTRDEKVIQRLQGKALSLEELSPTEAKVLLQKLIAHPKVTEAHLNWTVALLNGHPLALELAATSLNLAEDSDHIKDILNEYQKGIEEGSPFDAMPLDAQTPRSLNVVFERSYNILSETVKAYFRMLGVLAADAPWNRPLMAAIWQIEDERTVRSLHQELRTRALIAPATGINEAKFGEGWYQQHRLLRTYALGLLKDTEDLEDIFARYANKIIEISGAFRSLPPEHWGKLLPYLVQIQVVGGNLVKSFEAEAMSIEQKLQAKQFALNICQYLNMHREVHQINWLEMGVAVSDQLGDPISQALFQVELGLHYSHTGEKVKALGCYEQALAFYRSVNDQRGEARTITNIGLIYSDLGKPTKALVYYQQGLPILQMTADKDGEAAVLNNIGLLYLSIGERHLALDYYQKALFIRHEMGSMRSEATILNNIGRIYTTLGESQSALGYLKQSLALRIRIGDQSGEATTLNNIGVVWDNLGNKRKALIYYEQALSLRHAVGDRGGEGVTLNNIGKIYEDLGKHYLALQSYQQALPLRIAVGDRRGEADTLYNLAIVYDNLGDFETAIDCTGRAVILDEQTQSPSLNSSRSLLKLLQIKRSISR